MWGIQICRAHGVTGSRGRIRTVQNVSDVLQLELIRSVWGKSRLYFLLPIPWGWVLLTIATVEGGVEYRHTWGRGK